jgi:hypothetical protein
MCLSSLSLALMIAQTKEGAILQRIVANRDTPRTSRSIQSPMLCHCDTAHVFNGQEKNWQLGVRWKKTDENKTGEGLQVIVSLLPSWFIYITLDVIVIHIWITLNFIVIHMNHERESCD